MKKLLWHLLAVLCLAILISCVVAGVALAGSYTYAGTWGSKGSGNGQFDGIGGIAADASGNFYVADIGGKRIEKFSSNGTYLLQWATGATVDGVAVDKSGNVYASDYWNGRILKYDPTGAPLGQYDTAIAGDTQSWPHAIAVDGNGTIWITDSSDYLVKKFSATGAYLGTLGAQGNGAGQFSFPVGVAVDPSNNVYVTDCTNYTIQKFSSSGGYLEGGITIAAGDANLLYPLNVTVDSSGDAFVSDSYSGNLIHDESVKLFNPSFVFQTRIGIYSGSGQPAGTFGGVGGLALDASGNVYVADNAYDRILKFATSSGPPPSGAVAIRLSKSPTGTSYTIKRHNGSVSFTYSATLQTNAGVGIPGRTILLQKSADGVHFTTVKGASMVANAKGVVTVPLVFKTTGTGIWRWLFAGDSQYLATSTSKTKITVR